MRAVVHVAGAPGGVLGEHGLQGRAAAGQPGHGHGARAFTLVKDPRAAHHPISPYKNATRLVAFVCAYLGGPAALPSCSYTDASTGVALMEPWTWRAPCRPSTRGGSQGSRFKAGQDEEDAGVSILLQPIVSVVALPADAVLALSKYLRLLDQVLVTGRPSTCKQSSISLTWGQYSHYDTTITAGDTVQWVAADQKAGDSLLAGYAGTGSGNLTVSRVDTCSANNTAGLGIQQLPPAPCALGERAWAGAPLSPRRSPLWGNGLRCLHRRRTNLSSQILLESECCTKRSASQDGSVANNE
eukprot:jgi/Mesen1/178/ME1135311C07609